MFIPNTPAKHMAVLDANFAHLQTALLLAARTATMNDASNNVAAVAVHGVAASGKTTLSDRLGDAFDGLPILRFDAHAHLPDDERTVSRPSIVILDNLYGDSGRVRSFHIRTELPAGSILVCLSQDASVFPEDAIPVTFFNPTSSR